jgi:hypothetical protein
LYIITTDVSAPENRNKVITLAVIHSGGLNLNTISGIISAGVEKSGFES